MVLALLLQVAVGTSDAMSSAQDARRIDVVVKEAKTLRIVREGKSRALSGELSIAVANTGREPVDIETLDVHGIQFRNAKTGAEHVMLHPCDCAFIAWGQRPPENRTFTLAPGESRTFKIDGWSCGGSVWPPPGPGTWEVRYRVLTKKRDLAKKADLGDPKAMMKACDAALRSDEFWADAAVSAPFTITLKR